MAGAVRRIPIDKDSDLGRQLAEAHAAGVPVVLEVDGHAYHVSPEPDASQDDPWKDYNPEKARAALAESAGALERVDRAQLLRDIYAARGQDSHGRPA
jgi:hypothetical protein